MKNIMVEIQYDGTNYSGWQIQPNSRTIQEEIMRALKKLTGKELSINGSGRTDAGVHAYGQVASFILESNIPVDRLPLAFNSNLPNDISIINAMEVPMDFHARYSAIGKRYIYHIYEGRYRNPLLRNYSYHVHYKLDHKKMRDGAKLLLGTHDFRGFMSSGSSVENTVRTIRNLDIIIKDNSLYVYIEGDGFLYNMVRIITGTLVEVGMGKISIEHINRALETKDRTVAGHTAPPQGLFLDKVFYPLTH
ncbi:tRNA pseudouridine(38-40) synthase TruA [Alkaliphilus sp. MSJ-5]|uniref:tRNA pseudouridine synthase A n=1 Tax=Alkaliphilus flagellatus TaxID=2841507 RepID=A0ABS6G7K3_9FIRM|nr:tRNA pseudouridine(38-40) synthase TruA [Alkaliphilus flagellatus]MBU5678094.1 tRNA pseudouridine(38-40) synthase TruA [Alkaliphilus flagellatus]